MARDAKQCASYLLTGGRVEPPVKNTFIHFKFGMESTAEAEPEQAKPKLKKSNSVPSDLQSRSSQDISGSSCSWISEDNQNSDCEGSSCGQYSQHMCAEDVALDPSLPSIGAIGHDEGTCKPCAWIFKPSGCVNGRNCMFCHICGQAEFKKRKQDRVAFLRAQEKKCDQTSESSYSASSGTTSTLSGINTGSKNLQAQKKGHTKRRSGGTATSLTPSSQAVAAKEKAKFKVAL